MDVDMDNMDETPMAAGEQSPQPSRTIDPDIENLANLAENLDLHDNRDVDFRCQGWSIKAHKHVIREKAPKLAEMCQGKLGPEAGEDARWNYNIQGVDHENLWLFVRFLYKGRLAETTTFKTAFVLYEIAHIYQARGLARACAPILVRGLTVENAWDVLNLAYAYGDGQLRDEVSPFIRANRVAANRAQWLYFKSTDVYREWYEESLANGEAERLMERMRNRGCIVRSVHDFAPPSTPQGFSSS